MTMIIKACVILTTVWACGFGLAAAGAPAKPVDSRYVAALGAATSERDAEMTAMRKEVDDARASYLSALASHTQGISNDTISELWQTYRATNDARLPRILELVRLEPTSGTAFQAIEWVVSNPRIHLPSLYTYCLQAIELLRDYHATNPKLGMICGSIGRHKDWRHKPSIDFLRLAILKNPDPIARGQATLALACLLEAKTAWLEDADNKQEAQATARQVEELLQAIIENCNDCPAGLEPKPTLGEHARTELYKLRFLAIGKAAPETEGQDLDGRQLKLSDYRGNVVVLTFWATWCGPCMEMVPQERLLSERLKSKPFVLLGVNGDEDKIATRSVVGREKITWPSFWNGGPDGRISMLWQVSNWPTVYVIDPKGVIRWKLAGSNSKNLDEIVDLLLIEFRDKKKD